VFEHFLYDHVWLAVLIWVALYTSDYYLTICGARLYQSIGKAHIGHKGSYELTPMFQKDVDALRAMSPRHILFLVVYSVWLLMLWAGAKWLGTPQIFSFAIGCLFLIEIVVHIRHLENLHLYGLFKIPGAISGKIEYSRLLTLRRSAWSLFSFGILFLILALVSSPWFFLGGTLSCIGTGWSHWRSALQSAPNAAVSETAQ
jgi:hypothetical protein